MMLDARCSMLDARCSMLDARCSMLAMLAMLDEEGVGNSTSYLCVDHRYYNRTVHVRVQRATLLVAHIIFPSSWTDRPDSTQLLFFKRIIIMSVLLFMPESGGNPLDSVILTSVDGDDDDDDDGNNDNDDIANTTTISTSRSCTMISRFEWKDGKPVRKLSSDSASMALSILSADITEGDDFSSLEGGGGGDHEDDDASSFAATPAAAAAAAAAAKQQHSFHRGRRPLYRTRSAPAALHPTIADAKQPQLRLTPMAGAILGATVPGGAAKHIVKVVNKAHEQRRKLLRLRQEQQQQQQQTQDASPNTTTRANSIIHQEQPRAPSASSLSSSKKPPSAVVRAHSGFLV